MNNFGISQTDWIEIIATLKSYPMIKSARLFGSRAKGSFKRYSDIDLCIYGDLSSEVVNSLKDDLEELYIIYRFDVVHFESLANQALQNHIQRVGIEIYPEESGSGKAGSTTKD